MHAVSPDLQQKPKRPGIEGSGYQFHYRTCAWGWVGGGEGWGGGEEWRPIRHVRVCLPDLTVRTHQACSYTEGLAGDTVNT